ncbi:MAG: hypothetical protein VKK42_32315 [Lyngbya sp.]|nr:hypothetical protein [Lyngbya sp.]
MTRLKEKEINEFLKSISIYPRGMTLGQILIERCKEAAVKTFNSFPPAKRPVIIKIIKTWEKEMKIPVVECVLLIHQLTSGSKKDQRQTRNLLKLKKQCKSFQEIILEIMLNCELSRFVHKDGKQKVMDDLEDLYAKSKDLIYKLTIPTPQSAALVSLRASADKYQYPLKELAHDMFLLTGSQSVATKRALARAKK